jgi:hypothetical protein
VNRRLERLEATLTATPADRGSYCPQCGGINIEDALLVQHTLAENGAMMGRDQAEAVCSALEAAEGTCRRCGDVTLAGALLDMLAADEQK